MQVFHRSTNVLSRVTLFGGLIILAGSIYLLATVNRSPWVSRQGIAREQPIQFSHRHHAGELGIDCRYCHTTVEELAYAGMPPTQTCINCHSQIWSDSPYLEPLRASWREETPNSWTKVYDLPGYVYFDHSVHVTKGVGCTSCHGDVDNQNVLWQEPSLHMEWCLDCHRNPERVLRPAEEIFSMGWERPSDQAEQGAQLAATYDTPSERVLTSCSTCHR